MIAFTYESLRNVQRSNWTFWVLPEALRIIIICTESERWLTTQAMVMLPWLALLVGKNEQLTLTTPFRYPCLSAKSKGLNLGAPFLCLL